MSLSDSDHRADVERKLQEASAPHHSVLEHSYEWSGEPVTDFSFRLPRNPVVPSSLSIDARTVRDVGCLVHTNDAGLILGDVGVPGGGVTNCVHHLDGWVSVRFVHPVASFEATYHYERECPCEREL